MHFVSLGLKDKTVEGLLLEKDHDTDTSMSPKGDRIEWKNNKFKVDSRDFKRQFKVGAKAQFKEARKEDVETDRSAFKIKIAAKKENKDEENEDLELFFEAKNAKALELKDTQKQYGSLILTPQNNIVDAYFAKVANEKMALDAPMETLKNKIKGNKKGEVEQHEKLTDGVIGQKIKLVAEVDNLENDTEVVFQLFEKTPLLTTKDTALKVVQDSTETDEVTAKVKDGYAVVEIELRPKADTDFKKWLTTLKIDGKPSERKKSYFFIEAKEKGNPSTKEFYKEQGFKVISTNWHEPVDNPQRTMYSFDGVEKPKGGAFGLVRTKANGTKKNHQGADIFALPNENIFSSTDGVIYDVGTYGHAGKRIVIKVNNPQNLINRKLSLNYSNKFTDEQEKGGGFNFDGEIYLFYFHLSEFKVIKGQKVEAGKIIGLSGVTGNANKTRSPHLHFEILNTFERPSGLAKKHNPAYFIDFNSIDKVKRKESVKYRYYKDGTKKKV